MNLLSRGLDPLTFAILPFVVIVMPVRLVHLFRSGNLFMRASCVGLGLLWAYCVWRVASDGFLHGPEFWRHSSVARELWLLAAVGWAVAEVIQRWMRSDSTATSSMAAAPTAVEGRGAAKRWRDVVAAGWPIWGWATVLALLLALCGSFGTRDRWGKESGFVLGVILLQAMVGTVLARLVTSLFRFRSLGWWLLRLGSAAALTLVLTGLSFCSSLGRHGWG